MNQHLRHPPATRPRIRRHNRPLPPRRARNADTWSDPSRVWHQPAYVDSGIALSLSERNVSHRWDETPAELVEDDESIFFCFLLLPDAEGETEGSPAPVPHPSQPGGTQGGADPQSVRERN